TGTTGAANPKRGDAGAAPPIRTPAAGRGPSPLLTGPVVRGAALRTTRSHAVALSHAIAPVVITEPAALAHPLALHPLALHPVTPHSVAPHFLAPLAVSASTHHAPHAVAHGLKLGLGHRAVAVGVSPVEETPGHRRGDQFLDRKLAITVDVLRLDPL